MSSNGVYHFQLHQKLNSDSTTPYEMSSFIERGLICVCENVCLARCLHHVEIDYFRGVLSTLLRNQHLKILHLLYIVHINNSNDSFICFYMDKYTHVGQ